MSEIKKAKKKRTQKKYTRSNDVSITFRTTQAFKNYLIRASGACKLTQAEFIRKSCLQQKIRALPPEIFYEIRDILREFEEEKRQSGGFLDGRDIKRLSQTVNDFCEKVDGFYADGEIMTDGNNKNMAN